MPGEVKGYRLSHAAMVRSVWNRSVGHGRVSSNTGLRRHPFVVRVDRQDHTHQVENVEFSAAVSQTTLVSHSSQRSIDLHSPADPGSRPFTLA